ncbi:unnamed protein product [Schistocephalus solidus]|uniref:UmuC domain-containing protein n=1 Tax=Schistocephalus solidus TaxID=70667 RepID=A0A183SW19_SCHSO|nr:unnamed protein product [Schistocephalus solidus]
MESHKFASSFPLFLFPLLLLLLLLLPTSSPPHHHYHQQHNLIFTQVASLSSTSRSKFFENEVRRGAILKKQIEQKLVKMESLAPEDIKAGEREASFFADKLLEGYRSHRDLTNCIVHVDMDAFYAAVEMRDDPSLRLKPLASTSNYIARRYGVRAAMPGFLGRKLCPQLVIVPPDFAKYAAVSQKVREILAEYCLGGSAGMVTMSLDEAYLNITQHVAERATYPSERRTFWPRVAAKMPALVCRCQKSQLEKSEAGFEPSQSQPDRSEEDSQGALPLRAVGKDPDLAVCLHCGLLLRPGQRLFGTSVTEAVREMRFRVFCATQLTCSAGIAPNSLLAKIASDWNKPNGQHLVEPTVAAVDSFILGLPIRKVSTNWYELLVGLSDFLSSDYRSMKVTIGDVPTSLL